MEPDWKEIARNISDYVDNDTFLSARSPQQIAKILSYAKLSPCEFATLFTNLSNYHGKADILMMLSRTRLKDFNSQEEASEISDTISSILGIQILDSLFSFYQNKLQQEISETKITHPNLLFLNMPILMYYYHQGSDGRLKILT
ncbi:hypothetical protein TVAG_461890 [Trichomonas vaginalis G3]|uniref:Uncharacterized protein n=1 Tax=Trichomonas vaginalis (strain ATCC PRA-98 / G3) TaxID=412133 RepID=A2FI62_TRIV3|nr:hypothetical protein TVAG_461890 [Trichomonas vaginalis G3]|eukprot:XP_001308345.1 hypothetical protein [Trichomonas vaginalis G3]